MSTVKDLAWAASMETAFPPEHYQMTVREVCLFRDTSERNLLRAMYMAYNYGFQRGRNAERNRRRKSQKEAMV